MAVTIKGKKGGKVTLLNPAEKGEKYADELRNNVRLTNDKRLKLDSNSKPMRLTATQRAYRSGYLDARTDGTKVFNAKNKKD